MQSSQIMVEQNHSTEWVGEKNSKSNLAIDHPLETSSLIDIDEIVEVNEHTPMLAQIPTPSVIRDNP